MATQVSLTKSLVALLIILLAGSVAWTTFLHSKARPYMGELMYGVYLPGNDIESALANEADSEEQCSDVCLQDGRCKAMSFVQRSWGGGVCRIKNKVPARSAASNGISAVKVIPW
ncbi:MAG TPA: PAN domain-containing protein [Candidatus Sulfotelmatobacter sp.]|nr:PAN domain-containing protein [Candidatus Sulfotelmatobacter sp.]